MSMTDVTLYAREVANAPAGSDEPDDTSSRGRRRTTVLTDALEFVQWFWEHCGGKEGGWAIEDADTWEIDDENFLQWSALILARARKLGIGTTLNKEPKKVPIPSELRWAVWERDRFTCLHCGTRRHLSIDHVIPESKGGPATLENLQTLCKPCNSKKRDRL